MFALTMSTEHSDNTRAIRRIGIIGGTGKEARGLALRWARAGHQVALGSRDAARAQARADELSQILSSAGQLPDGAGISGTTNVTAARAADVVLLAVPYSAHEDTLRTLADELDDKILIDITVPLVPPKVRVVNLPAGQSAALEAQQQLGENVRVVATMHHISAVHLADLNHTFDCDVLVCGDDRAARDAVISLLDALGLRGLDAGALKNSIALEAITPVLLHINKRYGSKAAGVRITGLPEQAD
ncbi:MAG: NADPH-dependent F420 reductase [Haliangiales bacterium]